MPSPLLWERQRHTHPESKESDDGRLHHRYDDDPEVYRKYAALTPALLDKHGGRFLTRGDAVETLEGDEFTERTVLLEFPDRESALAWYNDPEYQRAADIRRAASTGRVTLQAGRDDTAAPDRQL